MLAWLLNLVYLTLLTAFSPVIAWTAWRTGKYREGYAAKLLGLAPVREGGRPCVWLHAVSVGEVNLLATTLRTLAAERPDCELVISTTTKTGYDLAQKKYGSQHPVFYCPLDFSWAVKLAMRRVRPDLLVLAELELWPNLISAARSHGARVAIINGRLSENSFKGYRRVRPLAARVLRQVDLIAAQDQATAERFAALLGDRERESIAPPADAEGSWGAVGDPGASGASGVSRGSRITVTGSLKYDGAETDRANERTTTLRGLAGLTAEHTVLLAGSTQAPEEQIAIDSYRRLAQQHPGLRLVLVPRHPERFEEVAALLRESGLPWTRRTQMESALHNPQPAMPQAILVDVIGELGAWWGAADIGFVGGSFGDRGGQNMIEPAAYGVATCFGPNTRNFRDIVRPLLAAGGAVVVNDAEQLESFVWHCLRDRSYAAGVGERARRFVATQLGATERTVELLRELLPAADSATQRDAA
ncbi:3-deoxy-D-manno-octulosonic acid transferase [Posidoniimonas polymericola]|uniref:3-deoxy-D-manno-octulosonic acid transferase n=1 Tax=Posidoniimonas polymericola TaxID=2528002 RepID=A0A5C5YQX1_9BACT|nr:3-deoxy-D-manno-octulosonic acid transferase [Posidoniimonas polymericola]TWT77334.1 3-deoxy-D-manno-octulosonic acid transferase [Posidoniimonas polymericola]